MRGFSASEAKACRTWLSIGSLRPASAPTREGVALSIRVVEIEDAALAHHGVVVDVLLEPFPELHRPFVERHVPGQEVVRADDRGVAADVPGAEVALLQHGDVRDAVLLREV